LDPILRAKVYSWASSSGGFLPAAGRSGDYVAAECGGDSEKVQWAQLKSVERAVEKVVRVYSKVFALPNPNICSFLPVCWN
jgi:hypothetical protein